MVDAILEKEKMLQWFTHSLKNYFVSWKNKRYADTWCLDFEKSPAELEFSHQPPLKDNSYIEIPTQRCLTGYFGFPLAKSPFSQTLREYAQSPPPYSYSGSYLEIFYQQHQPASMADLLSLDSEKMQSIPAIGTVMPWWKLTVEACLKMNVCDPHAKRLLSIEARAAGLENLTNYGWQYFGPVSHDIGMLEFKRLIEVYDSIKANGFYAKKSAGIHGEFLIDHDDWSWVLWGGKHRVAALEALGAVKIPVSTKSKYGMTFVRREEVDSWFHVANGLFTKQEALLVFDSLIAASCIKT